MAWPAYALTHGESPFFTDFILYPAGVNLLWNASVTLPALVAAPLTLVGGPILTYNVLLTAAIAASCWTAFLACRSVGNSFVAAFAGGLLYGFSPFMTLHALGHLNIVMAFVPPLCVLLLAKALRTGDTVRAGAVIGLLLAAQVLIWHELVVSTIIGLAIFGLAWVLNSGERGRVARSLVRTGVAGAITFAIAAGGPVAYFLFGPQRPEGALHEPGRYALDVRNLVLPSRAQLISPGFAEAISIERAGASSEWNGYLGVPLLMLLAYCAWRGRKSPWVKTLLLAIVFVTVLASDPSVHVGTREVSVLRAIPVVNHLLPSRLMIIAFAFIGLLVAHVVDQGWLIGRFRIWPAALVLIGLTWFPALPFPRTDHALPGFFRSQALEAIPDGSVALVFPSREGMVWQARAQMPYRTPTGRAFARYTGRLRATKTMVERAERGLASPLARDIRRVRDELRTLSVETIIVGPMEGLERVVDLFTAVVEHEPRSIGGIYLWRIDGARASTPASSDRPIPGVRPEGIPSV